jgi:hypothetical protein
LSWSEEVRVHLTRAAAEGAKLAADKTYIRKIYISIYNVSHDIAGHFPAKFVARNQQREQIITFGVGEQQTFMVTESCSVLTLNDALNGTSYIMSRSRRDIGPGHIRKAFEFRSRAHSRRHLLSPCLTEQVVLARTDQFARAAATALVLESTNNAERRSIKLAADQARSASDLVGYRFGAGVQHIAMRVALAAIIGEGLHSGNSDGDFRQSFAPGAAK